MNAVGVVAADSDRESVGNGQDILRALVVGSLRRPRQVVAFPGLVINDRDGARRAGAEVILRCSVGDASGGQDSNV
jgi:hypothetical protein